MRATPTFGPDTRGEILVLILGLVVMGLLFACDFDFSEPTHSERVHARVDQAVRPNTDVRGERLCADHGGYEGYVSGRSAVANSGASMVTGGGSALLCGDGTAFRTFNTGSADRWIRQGEKTE